MDLAPEQTHPIDPLTASSERRLVVGGMLALAAVFGFGRFVYTPILPHMIADGLTPSEAGGVAAANYLGYLVGALVGITGLMQRGAWAWLVGSVALSGVTLIAMGFANSIIAFVVVRTLNGFSGATVIVSGATLIFGPLLLSRRPWYVMAPFCGVGLGIAASSALVAALSLANVRWQTSWIASGLVGCIMAGAIAFLIPRASSPTDAPRAADSGRIVWSRRLVLLTISYGLFGIGYVITATFIVVITRETPAVSALEPYVWSIVGLAGAVSIPLWSKVTGWFGEARTYAIMMVAEAMGVALSVVWPSKASILASAVLLGGTIMAITAVGLQLGRRVALGAPQKISAIMTAAFGVGQVVGPLIAGHMREVSGSFLAPSLIAAAALVVGAVLALAP